MKAVDANLLELLSIGSRQFVVPIYQRVYSWGATECEQLWTDVVRAGKTEALGAHFTGSIVYVERDQGTRTSAEPDLIIDGQQRITTVTLLLAALAARLEKPPEKEQEPVDGFSPRKIRGRYLTNSDETGEKFFKLILSQADKDALKAIVRHASPTLPDSRVLNNFRFFESKLADDKVDLVTVCLGLKKLVVVDVKLSRGIDHPQLVFEAMNSTGKKLSQADLIRNFVLMDLPAAQQERLYEDYWFPMEKAFKGPNEKRFDEFVRHYLTVKTAVIPRLDDIYDAFKEHASDLEGSGTSRDELVIDLSKHAQWFVAMALGKETEPRLAKAFAEIEQLKATVVYPFLLRIYADYNALVLTCDDFLGILETVISYLFRRSVCRIPTNSLNNTFAGLGSAIRPEKYFESVWARFLTLPTYKRFPTDQEFEDSLQTEDLYHFQRAPYFFRKMENYRRKEEVATTDYSIEHIMPQNDNLSIAWQDELGEDWQQVHDRLLNTLGNLTLTGYNPEYSDRPFHEKRDMENGFKQSPLRLNQGLGQLDTWNEAEIQKRAATLAQQAIATWPRPHLREEILADYRSQFTETTGFDWSLTHSILEKIPEGKWTGYYYLAEAVGTSPKAVANHVSKCPTCTTAYRVLTWDGRIADGFAWTDPTDDRNPAELLQSEGVRFIDDKADPGQRLLTEDLLALAEELA